MKAIREEILSKAIEQIVSGGVAKKQAARALHETYPHFWSSVESARLAIRWKTGARGNRDRHKAKIDYRLTIEEGMARLPVAAKPPKKNITLTGRVLIGSDIHFPHHDEAALEAFLNQVPHADHIILNGDIVDFGAISHFTHSASVPGVKTCLHLLRNFLATLRALAKPDARIVYVIGNHEERLVKYLQTRAPELEELEELSYDSLFRTEEFGIELVWREPVKIAGLSVIHGHEWGKAVFSPVNPARGAFTRAKSSVLCGHHHQRSSHTEGTLDGDIIGCWSTGCLCDLSPDYSPFAHTRWNHGFAVVESDGATYDVHNYMILPNGKLVG